MEPSPTVVITIEKKYRRRQLCHFVSKKLLTRKVSQSYLLTASHKTQFKLKCKVGRAKEALTVINHKSQSHTTKTPGYTDAIEQFTLGNCIDTVAVVPHKIVHQLKGGSKMVPTLYYLPPSPPCRSILLLGKILGIDFDLKTVNVLEGEQLSPDFTRINPQHCIPTLNDEGLVLWESRAILQYLAAAYGKDDSLYPKDVRTRAMVDQRLQFDLSTLYARTFDYFFPTIFHGSPLNASKKAKLCEAFNWFNEMLRDHEFSATDNFTIADITLSVTVSQCEAFGFDISAYDHVMVWLQRCKDYLLPYEYEELNATKAVILADMFRAKLGSQKIV